MKSPVTYHGRTRHDGSKQGWHHYHVGRPFPTRDGSTIVIIDRSRLHAWFTAWSTWAVMRYLGLETQESAPGDQELAEFIAAACIPGQRRRS